MKPRFLPAAALVLATAIPAAAQETAYPPGIELELGFGGSVSPLYEGSDEFLFSPFPTIRLERLTLPNGFQIGGGDGMGLSFYPSFGVKGERSAADAPILAGLPTVDTAIELGLGASYTTPNLRFYGELRRGVTGHDGFVGELGMDAIARPTPALELTAGPRATFADGEYMNTYFSVTPAQAAASAFTAFDAGSGFKSVGVETGARFEMTPMTALEASARYDRLIGDAGNSPITAAGTKDQFGFRLGIVRKFRLDF